MSISGVAGELVIRTDVLVADDPFVRNFESEFVQLAGDAAQVVMVDADHIDVDVLVAGHDLADAGDTGDGERFLCELLTLFDGSSTDDFGVQLKARLLVIDADMIVSDDFRLFELVETVSDRTRDDIQSFGDVS